MQRYGLFVPTKSPGRWILAHPIAFLRRVLRGFLRNNGMLLAGAVAYYNLLSIVPLFTLVLLALSQFVDPARLVEIVHGYLALMLPAQAGAIADEVATFLDHRDVLSVVTIGVMIFFSSLAFSVLEKAMAGIFHHRPRRPRSLLVALILPYLHVVLVGVGLIVVSGIAGALATVEQAPLVIGQWTFGLSGLTTGVLYALGLVGQILLLTSFYMVLPAARVSWRPALVGGIVAGLSWEIARRALVWYFSTLSLVNVIYGSLATAVVALLSLEVAGLIVLMGAQVIAEWERLADELRAVDG